MTEQEYSLGEEVTELAQSKKQQDTVVVSVRVSQNEFKRLEEMANQKGKSMSQIVRDAVSAYCIASEKLGYYMSIATSGGAQASSGGFQQQSFASFESTLQPKAYQVTYL